MALKPKPKYDSTQQALYAICTLAWNNCLAFLLSFKEYKAKYIDDYVTAKKDAITAAKALPDDQARGTAAEVDRIQLMELNEACLLDFQKLKGYIEDGFPKAEWKAHFEAAGQHYYLKASNNNWENTTGMNGNMNAFIADNTAALTTGGMPAGFPDTVTTDTGDFGSLYDSMMVAQETGVGTGGKLDANNALYDDVQLMFHDAKRVFPTDAEKLAQFTYATLKNRVSPPGSASLTIKVQNPDNSFAANVALTIQSETGVPIIVSTDANGEATYRGLDPDRYHVTGEVPTFTAINVDKDVDTGVNARLVVKLVAI